MSGIRIMDRHLQHLSDDPSSLFSKIGKGVKLLRFAICTLVMGIGLYRSLLKGEYGFLILCLLLVYPLYWGVLNIIEDN